MQTISFSLEIHNLRDSRDVYKIHRALLKEVYLGDFQSDITKRTLDMKIKEEDRETVIEILEEQGYEPRIIHRFTSGIEGIF